MGLFDAIKKHPLFKSQQPAESSNKIRVVVPTGIEAGSRDPAQSIVKRVGLSSDPSNRDFASPEEDLTQVDTAWKTEAYVRRAIDKYTELMFKAGWDLRGKNPNSVQYIRQRLAFIAECARIPTDILWLEIAEDIIKYNNCVVAKSRKGDIQWPQGMKVAGLSGFDPVVGYFPLNITEMQQKRDKNGVIKGWQQDANGTQVKYKTDDIIFYYYKKEKGKAFATPFVIPVLDDIRALRQAEENVLKLIYRNLFPFLHHQIGTDGADGQPGTPEEVVQAKSEIEGMDLEGGLVTTERHKITAIAVDQIIDAYNYLLYFERRVFTGLGMSEAGMGRGATSSRSTAENMQDQIVDTVKAIQRVMEAFTNEFIIKELLMEGGFDPILNENDNVEFIFKEIDVDMKIKKENHAIFQYEHNAITEDEMRSLLGRDPVTDRGLMFCNVVTIPVAQATADAKAAAAGTTSTPKSGSKTPSKPSKPAAKASPRPKPKKSAASASLDIMRIAIEKELNGLREDTLKLTQLYYAGEQSDKVTVEFAAVLLQSQKELEQVTNNFFGEEASIRCKDYFKFAYSNLNKTVVESLRQVESPINSLMVVNSFFDIYENQLDSIIDYITQDYEKIQENNIDDFEEVIKFAQA